MDGVLSLNVCKSWSSSGTWGGLKKDSAEGKIVNVITDPENVLYPLRKTAWDRHHFPKPEDRA